MNRRFFILTLMLALVATATIGTHIEAKNNHEPLNIVLILTDDQVKGTLQYMPSLLDRIAQKGVVFDNALVTNPVCSPSRASILSGGFHSHDTGVKSNGQHNGSLHKLDETRTLATQLQAAGYTTGFVGKYLHGYIPGHVPPGWSRFVANEQGGSMRDYWSISRVTYGKSDATATQGEIKYSEIPKRQYITEFQTDEAITFLENNAAQPFFLYLSYYAPHVPFTAQTSEDTDFAARVSYSCLEDEDYSDKPTWVKIAADEMLKEKRATCGKGVLTGQVALLQSVDRGTARIFDSLDRLGVLDNTAVFFMSDNGLMFGRSYLYKDKGMPYDGVVGVPLVAFLPGTQRQTRSELVAANLDVPATIYDIAGLHGPTDGISLLDLINDVPDSIRKSLLIENYGYLQWRVKYQNHPLPPVIWSGLRTPEWKYVEYTTGDRELYNLSSDPNETVNLISRPAHRELVATLARTLKEEKGLAITTAELPSGIVGQRYSAQMKAWGGKPPFKWSIEEGSLPTGLILDQITGAISGIPTESGLTKIRIEVEDTGKAKHSKLSETFSWEYELRVRKAGRAEDIAKSISQIR